MLIVSYSFQTEMRTRCFKVTPGGELQPVDCPTPREKKVAGLGDAVAAATSAMGIKPCGGCQRRKAALNRLVPFDRVKQLWRCIRYSLGSGT